MRFQKGNIKVVKIATHGIKYFFCCISFPNVNDLVINSTSFDTLDLANFLEPWRLCLDSFSNFGLPKYLNTIQLNRFLECINTMSKLTKLHLQINTGYRFPDNFTIVSQLLMFRLTSYSFDLVPILSHISSNIFLFLSNVYLGPDQLEELIKRNPLVKQKILGFDFGFFLSKSNRIENFSKTFHFVCDQFQELQFMDLMVSY